jgi:hypothetical protein
MRTDLPVGQPLRRHPGDLQLAASTEVVDEDVHLVSFETTR